MVRTVTVVILSLVPFAPPVADGQNPPETAAGNRAVRRLEPFAYGEVVLTPGPLRDKFERNITYLKSLTPDRFLWTFRKNAGLDAPGEPYGGWEEPKGELRGHSIGHYLSACARTVAQTGDAELKKNADYTVAELAKCQAKLGNGYLSAFPEEFFDRVERGQRVWAPYYTIHKIMLGLWEMYAFTGNRQALDALNGMAGYFQGRCAKLNDAQMQAMLNNEFGGMHEVLLNLYSVTGDQKHFDLAQRFQKRVFLDGLMQHKDVLPGLHANTHIPQVAGQCRAYELTNDEKYREEAAFFWATLWTAHSYATGGSNFGEHWGEANKLAATLGDSNQEFCTSYNWEKICRYLLTWTGEPRYADMLERNFYNGMLVSQHPQTGMFIYYMPFQTGCRKRHGDPFNTFTCCYGTGMQAYASLANNVYFHEGDAALYVNLFVPSRVTWKRKAGPVIIEQTTHYPEQSNTKITVRGDGQQFDLCVHMPWWAETADLGINGAAERVDAKPSSWIRLSRAWGPADEVSVSFPMRLTLAPMNDDPDLCAIMYGPLVLAGLIDERYAQGDLPYVIFTGDRAKLSEWITPVEGQPLTFRTRGQPLDLTLRPIHEIVEEPYGLYWKFGAAGSPAKAEFDAAIAARQARKARQVDFVSIGDAASEKEHGLKERHSQAGSAFGGRWRHALGEWAYFQYTLRCLPGEDNILGVTYWGGDSGARVFDIVIDEKRIATQKLENDDPGKMFTVEYPIPRKLTAGKHTITVRFEPSLPGATAGGIFGLATLRPSPAARP